MGSTPTSPRLREIYPAGNNLLEKICSIPEGFSLCPANCRAGNLGFSPSLINCNYLFEILKTAAKTMTTAATPKSSRRSEAAAMAAAMAAMGGALEGRRRRNGRGRGEPRRFAGRTMGKSTPIIPSMQLAQCPLLKTVETRQFANQEILAFNSADKVLLKRVGFRGDILL